MSNSNELIEALSWKIVSEFMRCFPGKFKIIETHPGGGQSDCLSIVDGKDTGLAHFNRTGRLTIFHKCDPSTFMAIDRSTPPVDIWESFLTVDRSIKEHLSHLLSLLNLTLPRPRPPSTSEILVYRLISGVLNYALYSGNRWECRNGFLDTSGDVCEVMTEYFADFNEAKERLRIRLPHDVLDNAAYRFWFLLKKNKPIVCLETSGIIWTKGGDSFRLHDIYKHDRRIWSLINHTVGNFLP